MYKFYCDNKLEFELPVSQEELVMFLLSSEPSLAGYIVRNHRRLLEHSYDLQIQFSKWCVDFYNNCPGKIIFRLIRSGPDMYVPEVLGEFVTLYYVPSLTNTEQQCIVAH